MTRQGLKHHHLRVHSCTISSEKFLTLFNSSRDGLGYPSWVEIPDRIEVELRYMIENFNQDELLKNFSMFIQKDWSASIQHWIKGNEVCM